MLASLYRLNSASLNHIYRLHFPHVSLRSCQYVMKRLVDWGAVVAFDRRMGGPLRGSGQRIFALDPAAHRLMCRMEGYKDPIDTSEVNAGRWSHRHAMTISELYVRCVEATRNDEIQLIEFTAEPASWWTYGHREILKPDAYLKIGLPDTRLRDHWWIEVDLGTESTPTVKTKFSAYLDFAARNLPGPEDTVPRVLVTVLEQRRCTTLKRLVEHLGEDARHLIHVVPFDHAVPLLSTYANAPRRSI
ncbi:replication-relaxation family protein [Nonomuraea typhae]|uniref:Replication-relaxation family protein n=1 Tax=Nonomuraea typhae TaxID=2603600 RepID=A0ABW7YLG3_9ACTN